MKRLMTTVFLAGAALAAGADWLSLNGDAQNSRWQRDEKILSARTVGRLQLLWQRKLSDADNGVTDPLILGPIITHRGIKELVFVQNAAGSVYAIDADLGRIFWTRTLGSPAACSGGRPVQPTMRPSPPSNHPDNSSDDDNFSDANRPLYTWTAGGTVYLLRPSSGEDFSPSFRFVEPDAFPVRMTAQEGALTVTTSKMCGGVPDASWNIPVNGTGAPAAGTAPEKTEVSDASVAFSWHGKTWRAAVDEEGVPRLLPAGDARQHLPKTPEKLATWNDAEGTQWICTTTQSRMAVFQVRSGEQGVPTVVRSWQLSNLNDAGAPVVANGVVYLLAKVSASGPLVLRAMDARTGEELYTSKDQIRSRVSSGNLAIANGHVCFSTTDSQTYCFGLPFEQ